ncbi:hypothetical protein DRQ53_08005 [bacterium]|nr:MAG: hypothetical protein DRQ53_08005 [bacterium]
MTAKRSLEKNFMEPNFDRLIVTKHETTPEWQRTALRDAEGTVFVPADVLHGRAVDTVFLELLYDGVNYVMHDGHLFVPARRVLEMQEDNKAMLGIIDIIEAEFAKADAEGLFDGGELIS